MYLLGIDIGTTHCKAGLFRADGSAIRLASRHTVTHRSEEGFAFYHAEELWSTVASAIREAAGGETVTGIGIASMAETGLLVDRKTGEARSPFLPWFDRCAASFVQAVKQSDDPRSRFAKTGLHANFKQGLTKLLWLRERAPESFDGAVWLSAADYIAYRLTGVFATDYTLAARTFAYDIAKKEWDRDWIRQFGLSEELFPDAFHCGAKIGSVTAAAASQAGIATGAAVAIAGHDHVVAALAVGAIETGSVYDSMGTAETLVGTLDEKPLGADEYDAGLSYGVHVVKGKHFFMGGMSASGGSVEWLRTQLGDAPLPYEEVLSLLAERAAEPTGILYFPYLSGSGAPMPDPKTAGAFVGLKTSHTKADLLRAVLEGTAYELESIRRAAQKAAQVQISTIIAIGGGTKNRHWLQVKADITGCAIGKADVPEATLLGAALVGGIADGTFADAAAASQAASGQRGVSWIASRPEAHNAYIRLYEEAYMPLQAPLRQACHRLS